MSGYRRGHTVSERAVPAAADTAPSARPAPGRPHLALLLGAAAALALPWLLGLVPGLAVGYVLYLLNTALIYGIVAIGLNLLIGYAGQFSIGHAGFVAVGAYASAILTQRYGWHFVLALPAAGLLAAAVGFLLGLPALRLSGPYLAVATLGFGVAVPQLILYAGSHWGSLTGGSQGLQHLPPPAIPIWFDGALGLYNFVLGSDRSFYYLALVVAAALTWLAANVVKGHTGRAFVAIRDSELAAQAMGVNLLRYKTTAFALSAFYAGVAGSLLAHMVRGISPEEFPLFLSITFLTMIIVGGLGTLEGALLGSFALTILQPVLSRLPLLRDFKNLYVVVFGSLLILAIIFLPRGIAGALRGHGLRGPRPDRSRVAADLEPGAAPPPVETGAERGPGARARVESAERGTSAGG
jgi:branched-chain amino acid transport system permease protein